MDMILSRLMYGVVVAVLLFLSSTQYGNCSPARSVIGSVDIADAFVLDRLLAGHLHEAEFLLEASLLRPDLQTRVDNSGMRYGDVLIHRYLDLAQRQNTASERYRVLRRARLAALVVDGKKSATTANIANELCTTLMFDHKLEDAVLAGQVALDDAQSASDASAIYAAQSNLARIHEKLGHYATAATFLQSAIQGYALSHPNDHQYLAQEWEGLGDVYGEAGQPMQALSAYENARKLLERATKGKLHQNEFSQSDFRKKLLSLAVKCADTHVLKGNLSAAANQYRVALAATEKMDKYDLAAVSTRLLEVLLELGSGAEAEELLRSGSASMKSFFTSHDGSRVDWDKTISLDTALKLQNKNAARKALLEAALKFDGSDDLDSTIALRKLASIYVGEKQVARALKLYRGRIWKSASDSSTYFPDSAWDRTSLTVCLSGYVRLLEQTGQSAEAKRMDNWRQELSKKKGGILDDQYPCLVRYVASIAGPFLDDRRYLEAEEILEKGLSLANLKCSEDRRTGILKASLVHRRLLLSTRRQADLTVLAGRYLNAVAKNDRNLVLF